MGAEATLKLILLGEDRSAGRTLKGVGGDAEHAESKLSKFGSVMSKAFVGGLLVGGAAMVKFGEQASDLAETQSKAAQIFGKDSVAALDKYASAADKAIGQSKQTALDALSTFGVFGKGAGLAGQDLVDFSTRLTTLSSDMASFSNTSPEEAIDAIGAALRGESEPIRKYGVLLDDATLRNRALKMGLISTTKDALTPQQKALAAQAEILKQTKDQQGDFARTSDGLANKQRTLKAELSNMTTELGEKSLPAMVAFVDALMSTAEWVDKNHEAIVPVVAVIGGFAAAVWAINTAARAYAATQAALNIVMSANPIGLVVLAIAGLVAAFVIAYQKSETFRDIVNGAWSAVGTAFRAVWNNFLAPVFQFYGKAIGILLSTWASLLDLLGRVPGFGWAKDLADKLHNAADAASNLDLKIRHIPDEKNVTVNISEHLVKSVGDVPLYNTSKPKHAVGTSFFSGGMTWVGERGPELVTLPRGSGITPMSRLGGDGGGGGDLGTVTLVVKGEDGRTLEQKFIKFQRDQGGRPLAFVTS